MDGHRFDAWTRTLSAGASRRRLLRGLAAGAVGAVAGALGLRRAGAGVTPANCSAYGRVCTYTRCCRDGAECRCYANGHCRCLCPEGTTFDADRNRCKPNVAEQTLASSPAAVWAAVTESSALAAWGVDNDVLPVVGHRFHLRGTPRPGFDGVLDGEVIEVDAPRRGVFSITGGPLREPAIVAVEVEPDGDGTTLRFTPVGRPKPCAAAMLLLGRDWQQKILAEALPRHLDAKRG